MKEEYKVLTHKPEDARLFIQRHTDTHFPITRFSSRGEVEVYREKLIFNLRVAAGLYPWPLKTPLNPRYETVGIFDGYSVKKVMFESRPGFWSTGNLYLPDPLPEKAPAILNVIGHWWEQRLHRSDDADYPQQFANFAKMGFICLATDMIGMVDSRQLPHNYGTKEKELWCSNGLGVQLWNNIRALDFLCSIPEVDSNHIGVTGASGGGSQTLFLSLVDDRIKAAAPINMISLHMQGGCQCENAPGLRRDTNNAEMCAMLAPRPLFLAGSTGDWTKNQEVEEYPAVLEAYRHFDAENLVEHFYQVADHQYNQKTRTRVYNFFARHLMGKDIKWEEQAVHVSNLQALTWFQEDEHAPGFENEEEFFAAHKEERKVRIESASSDEKRRMLAWCTGIDDAEPILANGKTTVFNGMTLEKSVITSSRGEQIPFIQITPVNWDKKRMCLALSETGKECVEKPAIKEMLSTGIAVISGDLFMMGECGDTEPGASCVSHRYFTTFQYTIDAHRVQDVALLWKYANQIADQCTVWAEGCAARAVACALPLLKNVFGAELEENALKLFSDQEYYEQFFVPGLLVIGGLEGCVNLADCPIRLF